MSNDKGLPILDHSVSFVQWRSALQAKLARRNVLGHVFHDIPGLRPITMPEVPTITTPNAMNMDDLVTHYIEELEQWILLEIEAKNIIVARLNQSNCPQSVETMTAKQLYDNIAGTRQETATAPYLVALENFLQGNNAADNFNQHNPSDPNVYSIGAGLSSALFVIGTKNVDWLNTWRETRVYSTDNQLAPLQTIMSSLRATAGNRAQPANSACAATGPAHRDVDPEANCTICRHRHKNKECFIQHPELKRKSGKHKRNKGKRAAAAEIESDSEEELRVVAASARINENLTIYDTGASHHFVSQTKFLSDLKPCPKPFRFDQAIGAASLQQQGNAQLNFGSLTLQLHNALYEPHSWTPHYHFLKVQCRVYMPLLVTEEAVCMRIYESITEPQRQRIRGDWIKCGRENVYDHEKLLDECNKRFFDKIGAEKSREKATFHEARGIKVF
ncbi:hypothetical protein K3495_g8064 [Podosphaera aphanis]|nr:hypothetical protein K3495_g8064 [Podosphaera aphanis]